MPCHSQHIHQCILMPLHIPLPQHEKVLSAALATVQEETSWMFQLRSIRVLSCAQQAKNILPSFAEHTDGACRQQLCQLVIVIPKFGLLWKQVLGNLRNVDTHAAQPASLPDQLQQASLKVDMIPACKSTPYGTSSLARDSLDIGDELLEVSLQIGLLQAGQS